MLTFILPVRLVLVHNELRIRHANSFKAWNYA
jgi:hypothetical protein